MNWPWGTLAFMELITRPPKVSKLVWLYHRSWHEVDLFYHGSWHEVDSQLTRADSHCSYHQWSLRECLLNKPRSFLHCSLRSWAKKTLTLPSDWNTLPFSSYQNLTYSPRLNSNATSSRKPSKPCRWSSYLYSLPSASWNCMDLLLLLSVPWNHIFLKQKRKLLPSSE